MAQLELTLETEEWRAIDGWPYEASSFGRIRRIGASSPLATFINKIHKYPYVSLHDGPRRITRRVHQLVCFAFHGPPPSPKHEVAHWDGNALNNRPSNLRWATHQENKHDDDIRLGATPRGSRNGQATLTETDVKNIRALLDTGLSQENIGRLFGVSQTTVWQIKSGKKWGWLE